MRIDDLIGLLVFLQGQHGNIVVGHGGSYANSVVKEQDFAVVRVTSFPRTPDRFCSKSDFLENDSSEVAVGDDVLLINPPLEIW